MLKTITDLIELTFMLKKAYANDAPTMKRWHPKAKGAAYPILKRSSHIGVVLADIEDTEE